MGFLQKAQQFLSGKGVTIVTGPDYKRALSMFLSPGSNVKYGEMVKDPMENSAVAACINWIARNFPEAPPVLYQIQKDGALKPLPNHPLIKTLRRPNKYYSGILLWMATQVSWNVDGNAYWLKVRNKAGQVVELWYVPHWTIEPKTEGVSSTDNFISYYEYKPDPKKPAEKLEVSEVVHFRNGLDPENPQKGMSPLKPVLREIFTDNEAFNFTAALLRNMGIPGVIISPDDSDAELDAEGAKKIKGDYKNITSGDNRGEPLVMNGRFRVTRLGFSPQEMDLTAIHRLPEERVSAVLNLPAAVAGLGAGLDRATYSNIDAARAMAFENKIIPDQRLFSEEINTQLVPDFENKPDSFELGFDLTKVRVLQEDLDALGNRLAQAVNAGAAKISEYRQGIGLPVRPGDEVFVRDPNKVYVLDEPKAAQPAEPSPEEKDAAAQKDKVATAKEMIDSGAYTVNEVREFLGLIPLPDGDVLPSQMGNAGTGATDTGAAGTSGGDSLLNVLDMEDGQEAADDAALLEDEALPQDTTDGGLANSPSDAPQSPTVGDTAKNGKIYRLEMKEAVEAVTAAYEDVLNLFTLANLGYKAEPKKTGPGSRGGKFWLDKNGKVRYGPPPAGMKTRTAKGWRAFNRRNARAELKGIKTGDELSAAGWESFGPDTPPGPDFGKDKAAAVDAMMKSASENPQSMFVVIKVDGAYVVASKLLSEIKEAPPPPKSAPEQVTQLNVGSTSKPKPKDNQNGPGAGDPAEGAPAGDLNAGK